MAGRPTHMLCFVSASLIARTLGRTGNAVLSRVLGMLAYSVQFVINGIAAVRGEPVIRPRQSVNLLILRSNSQRGGPVGKTAPEQGRFRLRCHIALTYFRSNKRPSPSRSR